MRQVVPLLILLASACGSESSDGMAGSGGGVSSGGSGGSGGSGNASSGGSAGSSTSGGTAGISGAGALGGAAGSAPGGGGGGAGSGGGGGGTAGSGASGGSAGSGSAACALSATPQKQTFFTRSPAAPDLSIENAIVALLDGAVAGSTARVAIYTFTRTRVADAILAAHQRGVDIAVIADAENYDSPGVLNTAVGKLAKGLPATKLHLCTGGGCIGTNINHNKLLTFSELCDGSKNVVVQSSANFTGEQLNRDNNAVVIRNDDKLYQAYTGYWKVLWGEKVVASDPYSPYSIHDGSTATRAYFFPRDMGTPAKPATDTIVSFLENVECDPSSSVDWVGITASLWSTSRDYILTTLKTLQQSGCRIEIAVDDEVELKAQIQAQFPKARMIAALHSKYLLVHARYAGSATMKSLVFTGSHNLTSTSLRSNDEAIVKIEDAAVFSAYAADFVQLK